MSESSKPDSFIFCAANSSTLPYGGSVLPRSGSGSPNLSLCINSSATFFTDAVGIKADDYYSDYQFIQKDNLFSGHSTFFVDSNTIDAVYSSKEISLLKIEEKHDLCGFHVRAGQ